MDKALTVAEKERLAELVAAGTPLGVIAELIGRDRWTTRRNINYLARRPAPERKRSPLRLSLAEREEISRGVAAGESMRPIARRLGRSPSTVSREISSNGGIGRYRAVRADRAALRRARRPKLAKLATQLELCALVESKLELRWSPQQISGWLSETYPDRPEMWVSHETIYLSLVVQSRGALRKELTRYLRRGQATRRPRGRRAYDGGRGKLRAMVNISERPAEIEDRAVPGHWEGDLVFGTANSAMATLVERHSRFVMLVGLPNGHTADVVADALSAKITELPDQLRRSLTWDQGKEMARHARFTVDTGVPVYFCDPHSPWQRGSNENTNGLLRQYFPKRKPLPLDQADLDAVADELNGRPRQTSAGRHHHKHSIRHCCDDPLRPSLQWGHLQAQRFGSGFRMDGSTQPLHRSLPRLLIVRSCGGGPPMRRRVASRIPRW